MNNQLVEKIYTDDEPIENVCISYTQYLQKNAINPSYLQDFVNYILNFLYNKAIHLPMQDEDTYLFYTDKKLARFFYYNVYEILISTYKPILFTLPDMYFSFDFYESHYKFITVAINYINFNFNKTIGYTETVNDNINLIDKVLNKSVKFIMVDNYAYPCFVNIKSNDLIFEDFYHTEKDEINYEEPLLIYLLICFCLLLFIFIIFRLYYKRLKKTVSKKIESIVKINNGIKKSTEDIEVKNDTNVRDDLADYEDIDQIERSKSFKLRKKCSETQNDDFEENVIAEQLPLENNISEYAVSLDMTDLISFKTEKDIIKTHKQMHVKNKNNFKKKAYIYATVNKNLKTKNRGNEV